MAVSVALRSDRVTVAKPGYNADSLPALDYAYVALDSRLPREPPLEIGTIGSFAYGGTYSFSQNYPAIPGIELFAFQNGSVGGLPASVWQRGIELKDTNGSTAYQRTSFYLGVWTDHFSIVDDRQFQFSGMFSVAWTAIYYVLWRTW
jgi:hypothetical protein